MVSHLVCAGRWLLTFFFSFLCVCMYWCMYVCRPEVDVWWCPQLLLHLIYLFKIFYLLLLCVCKCQWACCGMGVEVRGQIGVLVLPFHLGEKRVSSLHICAALCTLGWFSCFCLLPHWRSVGITLWDRASVFLWILGIEIRLSASAFISWAICLVPAPSPSPSPPDRVSLCSSDCPGTWSGD